MPIPQNPPVPVQGSQYSGLDIIKSTFRLINVIDAGENPSPEDAKDALFVLNIMLDAWNAERLMVFTLTRNAIVPTTLKQAYTVGSSQGADFRFPRPPRIEYVSVINQPNSTQPLELPLEMLNDAEWRDIPIKNVASSLPTKCYDDGGFPLRTLSFFPIPNIQVSFVLYYWTQLSQFPDLATQLSFPPGYAEAIRYNLAPRLAAEWHVATPAEVVVLAQEAKSRIKSFNYQPQIMSVDAALVGNGGQFNYLTGETR